MLRLGAVKKSTRYLMGYNQALGGVDISERVASVAISPFWKEKTLFKGQENDMQQLSTNWWKFDQPFQFQCFSQESFFLIVVSKWISFHPKQVIFVFLAEISPTCPTGVVVIFVKETNPEKTPQEISLETETTALLALLETVKLEEIN